MKNVMVLIAFLFGVSSAYADITSWEINAYGVLTIHLDGDMGDFDNSLKRAPWFNSRDKIKEVRILNTDKNTSIGSYAFSRCDKLTKITIPDNTTSVGEYAFSECSNLTDVTFPKSVTTIGQKVFFDCEKMKSCTCLNPTPPSTGSTGEGNIFHDAFYSGSQKDPYQNEHMDLYIPAGTLSDYNAVGTWRYFETKTVLATKISIIPQNLYVEINKPVTLQAIMPYDVTDKTVTWRSNNEQLVTVHNGELEGMMDNWILTGVANGKTTVTCTTSYGVIDSCVVTVGPVLVDSIHLYNSNISLPVGETIQMIYYVTPEKAAIQAVEWSSNKADIADVDEHGVVTAHSEGEAYIIATAIDGGGATSKCKVTVYRPVENINVDTIIFNEPVITLHKGTEDILTYQIFPLNASNKNVTWTSDDTTIATITPGADHAIIHAINTGEVTIFVTTIDKHKSDICKVLVIKVPVKTILIEGKSLLHPGDKTTLKATVLPESVLDKTLTWSSNNPDVAIVDNDGQVTAMNIGEADITAVSFDGIESMFNVKVTVTVFNPIQTVTIDVPFADLHSGESDTLNYKITPSDAMFKDIIWNSTDTTVLTISNNGVFYAKRGGNTIISLTVTHVDGDKTVEFPVHVIGKCALLKNIKVNKEVLQVDKDVVEYSIFIEHDIDNITVDVETADDDAIVQGTGTKYAEVGINLFIITVTSNDGTDIKNYKLKVTRMGYYDATLKELIVSKGTLTPEFNPYIFNYTDTVPYDIDNITILFKKEDHNEIITGGAYLEDGYVHKELAVGDNVFTVHVVSKVPEDWVVKVYVVKVRRLSNNALLKELTVNNGTLTPEFHPEVFNYTTTVNTPTTTIETKTSHDYATVSITDIDSMQLFSDKNFVVNVTSEDKTCVNTYTVNVQYIPSGKCGYDMTWGISKNNYKKTQLTVKGSGEMFEYPVTAFPWYSHSASIEHILIDEGVTTIGNFAFGMCENLKKVTNNNPPQNITDKSVFGSIVLSNIVLFVQEEYAQQYADACVWKDFAMQIEYTGISTTISPAHVYINNKTLYIDSPSAERVDIYSVTGKLLHRLQKPAGKTSIPIPAGRVLIVRGSSGWTKKLLNY